MMGLFPDYFRDLAGASIDSVLLPFYRYPS